MALVGVYSGVPFVWTRAIGWLLQAHCKSLITAKGLKCRRIKSALSKSFWEGEL